MKIPVLLLTGAFALALCGRLPAQNQPASTAPAAISDQTFTETQILESWGWIMAHDKEADNLEINGTELASLLKGVRDGCHSQTMPFGANYHTVDSDLESLHQATRAKAVRAITRRHEAEAARFFAGLKKNPRVIALPAADIWYEIIKPGAGPHPKPRQSVNVHYVGRLINGSDFFEMGPTDRILVPGQSVCRGWIEAIQKIGKGGVIKLYIPPPLPEKEAALMGIPPGSAMIFEAEVFDVKDPAPEDLADSLVPPAPEPPPGDPSGLTRLQLFEAWGWILAHETGVANLGFDDARLALISQGLAAAIKGEAPPCALEKIEPVLAKYARNCRERAARAIRQKRLADAAAFFARLKKNPRVVTLPDGLGYEIIAQGTGPFLKSGQIARVEYTGRLLSTDSEFDHTDGPADLAFGGGVLGAGWDEGMRKIQKGGTIKIYVPPALGYGDEDITGVPADSTLIFEVKLLDIKDAPPDTAADPGPEKK